MVVVLILNDPCAKLCVPDVVKNMSAKVFNVILITNEIRCTKWHKTCKCKYRLDASIYNNKQDGMKINADVNVKNWSKKEYEIKDLFGIQVIVNLNVINHVMLENI